MGEDQGAPADVAIPEHELARRLLDRQLLTNDRLLLAQKHAEEQHVDLRTALRELKFVTDETLDDLAAVRDEAASTAGTEESATTRPAEGDASADAEAPASSQASAESNPTNGDQPPTARPADQAAASLAKRDLRTELRLIAATAIPSDLIEQMLIRALIARATDIHIDPRADAYHVRFRIDGRLHSMIDLDEETGQAVVRGIKVMSELRLVESRHPQDGSMVVQHEDRPFNLRVATLPTSNGEKVVLRVLEPRSVTFDLGTLGLDGPQETLVNQFLARPYGVVLASGPVGAGKTTTLYSCLERVNHPSRNVMTIEDPVEYQFHGVNQVDIDNRIGFTFAEGLRSVLRQDPDILMIGEIRDEETAMIGIRAALTGVLVFSSVHASDAPATISTMLNYGIPGYTLASALQGVVNQRLVRSICPDCKHAYSADETVRRALKVDPETSEITLYRGAGCAACLQTGYLGRIGIFEVMEISDLIREMILLQTTKEVIREVARDEGMKTLRQAAIEKVLQGETTVEEMYRITI